MLVLAGAGTGKTRVLTTRIAHILNLGRARPGDILAVTFTNKAAREMKDRVGQMVGQIVEGMPWIGTFHSIGVKILRRHAELVGLKSNFTILDVDDQIRVIKQILEAEKLDEKRWPARVFAMILDGWKNRGLTPDQVPAGEAASFANGKGKKLYLAYQERLKTLNAADFGDLLLENIRLFRTSPDILRQYQQRFKFILVDEYQDTNVAQYLWLRLLAQAASSSSPGLTRHPSRFVGEDGSPESSDAANTMPEGTRELALALRRAPVALTGESECERGSKKNICCVGDDDQSIYGWRGAEVDNILRFDHDFPGAKIIRLERNYRSTGHILAAASHLIAHNEGRLGKTLRTEDVPGEKVQVTGGWDSEEEARSIGEEIEQLQRDAREQGLDHPLDEIAILVRASFQMREFEDRFIQLGLPYRVIGGPALLRARRNQGRAGLPARHRAAGRRPRLRAHRQRAQARPRRRHRADAARPRAQAAHPADRSRRRAQRHRRDEAEAAPGAARADGGFRALARAQGFHAAHGAGRNRAGRDPATRRCGRPTRAPTPPAGWKTSRSWCAPWRNSRTSPASSSTSRW